MFRKRFEFVFFLFITQILQLFPKASREYQYKSINCEVLDDEIMYLEHCRIKVITRNTKILQIKAWLKQTLSKNIVVHLRLMKKLSGWRPFLFNLRMKFCEFFENPERQVLAKIIFSMFENSTNFIHKCPYKKGEMLYLELASLGEKELSRFLYLFPIEVGEYGLFANVFVDGRLSGSINGTFTYADYSKNY